MYFRHLIWTGVLAYSALFAQTNAAPLVNDPLVPGSAVPGGPAFTLAVNGFGFTVHSVVDWNGAARATSFVSSSQLTASILAADIAAAGTASVTVVNPAPGGGASNVVFFPVAAPRTAAAFSTLSTYPANNDWGLAAADVNGDGKIDLVTSAEGDSIQVMPGNGDGTFGAPITSPCDCDSLNAFLLVDVNNDGKADIIWATNSIGNISVMLGNGDGTFQTSKNYPADYNPFFIVAGDFNGDGKLDLALICSGTASAPVLDVLLGNGDGTFQAPVSYAIGLGGGAVVGDFNGDGILDLAAGGTDGINVLIGKGDGTFRKAVLIPGPYSAALAAADFNGDGILDLATVSDKAYVLLGKGDGSFQTAGSSAGGPYPRSLVAADLNGDGILDLAMPENGSFTKSTEVAVGFVLTLLGKGDGTFQAPAAVPFFQLQPVFLAGGDFNGDGRADLAVLQYSRPSGPSGISVHLQTAASVSPGVLTFPPTLLGKTSAPKTVTLTNIGAAPISISQVGISGADAGEYRVSSDACTGVSVPAGGTCSVAVSVAPSAQGVPSATLTFTDNALASPQTVALTGDGTALEASPARVDFGNVKVGTTSPSRVIKVTNTGSQAVDVKGVFVIGRDKGDFYEYTTCARTLAPRATCAVVAQFIPLKKGSRKGDVSVGLSNTGSNPKPVQLSGAGM
jgi:hypothetical protein